MARYERWIACADTHGDMQDPGAVKAFSEFCKHWKPAHRIHLGDAWDFRAWRHKASEVDQNDTRTELDFDAGIEFVQRYKPTVMLWGNHDWRIIKAATGNGVDPREQMLAKLMYRDMLDALGEVKPTEYNKRTGVRKFGNLTLLHGYTSGVNAVRRAAMAYGSCLMGHLHVCECVPVERDDGAVGRCIGSLCLKEMGYNEAQLGTLRQANGWAYGVIYPNGRTVTWQAEYDGGLLVLPSEIREVKCA